MVIIIVAVGYGNARCAVFARADIYSVCPGQIVPCHGPAGAYGGIIRAGEHIAAQVRVLLRHFIYVIANLYRCGIGIVAVAVKHNGHCAAQRHAVLVHGAHIHGEAAGQVVSVNAAEALGYGQLAVLGLLLLGILVSYLNLAFRHVLKHYFLRSLAVYGYGGGFAVVAVYFGAALLLYGVFAGGHFNIKPELISLVQLVLCAVHGNGNLVAFGYIHALNDFLYGQFRLRLLLFGVGIGHGNSSFIALVKRYAVIRVKIAVFGLYEVVTIYVGHICLAHGVSARVKLYCLAELALFQGYGLIADSHGNFVIVGQLNAILKPFNLLYHGQLGLFGNALVFVDERKAHFFVLGYIHTVSAIFFIINPIVSPRLDKPITVYIGAVNLIYVIIFFVQVFKRMGEIIRLVKLNGQINRLIPVIHVHGNFVIIGNVNAFNGLLYGKLTGLYYRAMLDIFVFDGHPTCFAFGNGYCAVCIKPAVSRASVIISRDAAGSYLHNGVRLIGFHFNGVIIGNHIAKINLTLNAVYFHLNEIIGRNGVTAFKAAYFFPYYQRGLPRFGSGGRRGVDFPLGYKLCVGIHVKALSFAYVAARAYLLGEGQLIAALRAFCIIGHFPAEELYVLRRDGSHCRQAYSVGGMLPVLYIRYLGIVVCELGIGNKVALATAVCVVACHGCPHRAVVEQIGKLAVAREHVEYFAVVIFNINGLRYGRNLNKYIVTVVAAIAAVAEILAVKRNGQLERAVILLYGLSKAEGNIVCPICAPCIAAVRTHRARVYAGHNYSGYIVALRSRYGKLHALLILAACGSIIAAQRAAASCDCCVGILPRNGGAVQRYRGHTRAVIAGFCSPATRKRIPNDLYVAIPSFLI